MQRYIYILLFILVLVLPFLLLRAVIRAGDEPAVAGVGRAARLVIVTPHNQDIRREFARAFDRWHRQTYGQAVAIDYRMIGGTGDIHRMLETTYRGFRDDKGNLPENVPADIHIVWGGGDYFFDVELKPLGILQPMRIEPATLAEVFPEPTLAGVKLYDLELDEADRPLPPRWVGACLASFGIAYNPQLIDAIGLPPPRQWADLAHDRLFGLVALADPAHSGSAAVAYMMVLQRAMADAEAAWEAAEGTATITYEQAIAAGWKRGMGQLLLIAANARYFTDSASQVPADVANGEAAAGMAIDFYGRVYQEIVGDGRVRFISPAAATAITPDPVGILHGVRGEQEVLANRFVEFLLTPEAQRLWIMRPGYPDGPRQRGLRRPPIRRDVYDDRTGWSDDVNPFEEAGEFNMRGEWMVLFGETRLIWAAAWIDSRDALRTAYRRILQVPDDRRRAELIAELADLPIEMADVRKLREQRRQIEREQGSSDHWRARQRIEWGQRFREHYSAVAENARR